MDLLLFLVREVSKQVRTRYMSYSSAWGTILGSKQLSTRHTEFAVSVDVFMYMLVGSWRLYPETVLLES